MTYNPIKLSIHVDVTSKIYKRENGKVYASESCETLTTFSLWLVETF